MNILLTGGSGFVGSSIQEYFQNWNNYQVLAPQHSEVDLLNLKELQNYINKNKIEYVVHTACVGARRYARNFIGDVYTNLLMFENLVTAAQKCKRLVSFGSGGEFDINTDINNSKEKDIDNIVPLEYGGFLKRIIAKRSITIQNPLCFNARFFGSFGHLEENDRFIKGNLLNIIQDQPIIIHQDRLFDFIYVHDLAIIVSHMLRDNIPRDLNCVYSQKHTLFDIAKLMLKITNKNVDIIVENEDMGLNYTGDGSLLENLDLPLIGLQKGIEETYQKLMRH